RFELQQQNEKMENARTRLKSRNEKQHDQMVDMIKKYNELSLILYSQNQDFTFDVTYALKEVTQKYEQFNARRMPFDEIVSNLNLEIERYERLIESLRRLPPVLDEFEEVPDSISVSKEVLNIVLDYGSTHAHFPAQSDDGELYILDEQGQANRDSCVYYARNLLKMYTMARDHIIDDNEHYADLQVGLEEAYNYAQGRYRIIQKNIFIKGQDNYFTVLGQFPSYVKRAFQEAKQKYSGAKVTYDDGCEVQKPKVLNVVAGAMGIETHEDNCEIDGHHEAQEHMHEHEHEREHEHAHEHHHHHHPNVSEWRGPVVSAFMLIVMTIILLASALSTLIVLVLRRKIKRFNTESFRNRMPCIMLLAGVVIFFIAVMICNHFVRQNFIVMASGLLLTFSWLVVAILTSILIRVPGNLTRKTMKTYIPVMLLGLLVITFRIIFIPNKLVNLIFPPLLLGFFFWQLNICKKAKGRTQKIDRIYSWLTLIVIGATTLTAWVGYVLLSVQVFIWWLFQLAAIVSVTAMYDLMKRYQKKVLSKRVAEYKKETVIINEKRPGAFIEVTWFFDFVKQAAIPICAVLSIPVCIWYAADVFDLTEVCKTILISPFVNLNDTDGNAILTLSLLKILIAAELFFIFSYISYLVRAVYRHVRIQNYMTHNGKDYVLTNEINFTLADNLVSIIVWGVYTVMTIIMLKIPMGAISIVAAGLATGIGLALKDVLNNFIYGIQLMSGRLRVGDYIDCDGIRGKVENISYQCTQILTLDGSIMAITNTSLFNKNFKNLTRNNSYELVKIPVGVCYGSDVDKVRKVLIEALESVKKRDQFGRSIVDPAKGISVVFDNFGDSSVDLTVKQYVIVDQQAAYIAEAKEAIYKALNANNIEIPFPQRDVYIRQVPESFRQ
ncbi:MAG: mechanosensitive ion channel, partial [Bacteroidales bacterium]|nr:mechanosensitive ion channel [Bacteroidales bacterium]